MATAVTWTAAWLRSAFDSLTRKGSPVLWVALGALLAGGAGRLTEQGAAAACNGKLPISIFDLELTFSARTFGALLDSAGNCREGVILHFVTWDLVFPVAYAAFLTLLFLWVERYRRFRPDAWTLTATARDASTRPAGRPVPGVLPFFSSVVLLLPLCAAVLDVVAENIPLYLAARVAGGPNSTPGRGMQALVLIGSLGAALKWTLLSVYALGLLGTLLGGPRGSVLWRLRFSVMAILAGALPLLALGQGQDILQRMVEGAHPYWRVSFGLFALTVTALVVWYSARVLTLVRFDSDSTPPPGDDQRVAASEWLAFFERNIPRMLGVTLLVMAGAAFANAGLAFGRYLGAAAGGYLVAVFLARPRWRPFLLRLGRPFVIPRLRGNEVLGERFGRAVVASALSILIVWPAQWSEWSYDGANDQKALRVAAWAALLLSWQLYLFVYYRRDLIDSRAQGRNEPSASTQLTDGYSPGRLPPAAINAATSASLVSFGLLVLLTIDTVRVARVLGALVVVTAFVANAVFVGSLLAYASRRVRLPLTSMSLVLAAIFSLWNDNHAIRTVPGTAPPEVSDSTLHSRQQFRAWLARRAVEDSGEVPVILVAAAGGGLRAGYWTALALAQLHDRDSTFARHVFAISGVSGGSLGAALFAAAVRDLSPPDSARSCAERLIQSQTPPPVPADQALLRATPASACVRLFMNDDFLSPVLSRFLVGDLLARFLPVPLPIFDRATALERSWEVSYGAALGDSTLSEPFLSLNRSRDSVSTSAHLLLNTTHVQTGRRYVTSPFSDTTTFLDARLVHRALASDLRLSTAVHNSARFTLVSPAGTINRRDGVRYGALVDGGYFENSGLATVGDLYRIVADELQGRGRVTVLYLCNDPVSCRPDGAADSTLAVSRGPQGEVAAPILALVNTRGARGNLARAAIKATPNVRFLQLSVCDSLPVAGADSARRQKARERVVNPPLGWQLSLLARNWMDASLGIGSRPEAMAAGPGSRCRDENLRQMRVILDQLQRTRPAGTIPQ
jgi:hypothetical protein